MARRWAIAALALALFAAMDRPSHAQSIVGGTLDLGQTSPERSVVVKRTRAAAVAMLRGSPDVAAVGEPTARRGAGRVRIVRLASGEFNAAKRFTVAGPGRGARAGAALAAIDELVGDGDADLIVGAPGASEPGRGRPGAAFLISGERPVELAVGGPDVVTILGAADGSRAGAAVAPVHDVDGDGKPDIIVGAPGHDPLGRSNAGSVFLVPSSGLRLGDTVDLAQPGSALRIDGPAAGARAGRSVAGSRDTNGDRLGDVLLGAPGLAGGSGAAYLVRAPLGAPVDLAVGGPAVVALLGTDAERAGTAVAGPGDLNDDGLPEIAVGAPNASVPGRGETGVVYVLTPPATGGTFQLADVSRRIEGEAPGDLLGSRLAPAGNALGGHAPDLLITARGADPLGRLGAGAAYVVFGSAAAKGVDLGLLGRGGFRLAGDARAAGFGASIAGNVGVDRGKHDDVVVGAERSALLQKVPTLGDKPRLGLGCDSRPASIVLDASQGLFDADPRRLRGGAVDLLLGHPGTDDRLLAAVAAAPLPAEVFAPLRPGELTSEPQAAVAERLVDESVARSYEIGDLGQALDEVFDRNPLTESAIVVAGRNATWSGEAPQFRVDVVAVGVPRGSAQDGMLRSLARVSGGRYRRVTANRLQAQVAYLDARRRCEEPLPFERKGYAASLQDAVPETGVPIDNNVTVETESPENTLFVDIVLTTPGVEVEPEQLTITEAETGDEARFNEAELAAADPPEGDTEEGMTVTVNSSDTFTVLRVSFQGEHQDSPPPAEPSARISRHRRHVIHYGGYSVSSAAAAQQRPPGHVQVFHRVAD